MSNQITPFGSIERAVLAFLTANYAPLEGHEDLIGGDFSYTHGQPWYVRIDKLPGGTTRFQGSFVVEVEVFAPKYSVAESVSLDLEALFLGYPHVVEVGDAKWVFDRVFQNVGINDLPWEDDEVSRLGATYVITARRR